MLEKIGLFIAVVYLTEVQKINLIANLFDPISDFLKRGHVWDIIMLTISLNLKKCRIFGLKYLESYIPRHNLLHYRLVAGFDN